MTTTAEKPKRNKLWIIIPLLAILAAAGYFVYKLVIYPNMLRKEAEQAILEHRYERAMEIYEILKDEEGKRYTRYSEGVYKIELKEYENAIAILEDLNDYRDSKDKISEAKYGYVSDHYDNQNTVTYKYLTDLVALSYQDTKLMYSDLYDWRVDDLFTNLGEEDFTTRKTSFGTWDIVYVHYSLAGGKPGEKVRPRLVVDAPEDGDGFSNDVDIEGSFDMDNTMNDYYSWFMLYFLNPYNNQRIAGPAGTYYIKLYVNDEVVGNMTITRK